MHKNAQSSLSLPFLRPLFPSWRFFEDGSHTFQLEIECWNNNTCVKPWHPILQRPALKLWSLFYSAESTLFYAQQSLVDQISLNVCGQQTTDETTKSIDVHFSYLTAMARSYLKTLTPFGLSHYKLRIVAISFNEKLTRSSILETRKEEFSFNEHH